MKIVFACLVVLLTTSLSQAESAPLCFHSSDAGMMMVQVTPSDDSPMVREFVTDATLKLFDSDESEGLAYATLDFTTESGRRGEVEAYTEKSGPLKGRYIVECDGGSMQVTLSSDGAEVLTDGIRADIAGCDGEAMFATPGINFEPVACE